MAARASAVSQVLSLHTVRTAHGSKPAPPRGAAFPWRRELVLLSLTWTASVAVAAPGKAEDIGLFGIRKKLKEAERETELIVKEGFEAAEKGIESAEKGIKAAEKGIESAEKGLESAEKGLELAVGFDGLAQAGVVAGAEVVGVLVASSIVNGILGPES